MESSADMVKIADAITSIVFNENNIATAGIKGRNICIIKTNEGLKACVDRCPHAGGSLSEGYLDQHQNIVCPVHHYKFNLKTGRDAFNEGYFLKTFPVIVNDEGVFVRIRQP